MGRTIIVMIGAHLPARKIDLERVMLYAISFKLLLKHFCIFIFIFTTFDFFILITLYISVMDPVVESEYVLVYAHTNMGAENRPNFAWLRKMYSIFNRKYASSSFYFILFYFFLHYYANYYLKCQIQKESQTVVYNSSHCVD